MGESDSSMDSPIAYKQMGDSEEAGVTELDVSVSFGRFDNDVLDWEKWSTFPTNKYLEEVEKCSTPGSVAQKKAYFEAHYKRVAARKAEQEEQDKKIQNDVARVTQDSEKVVELDDEVADSGSDMSSDQVDEPKDSLDEANGSEEIMMPQIDLENEVTGFGNETRSDQGDEPESSFDMVNESKDRITLNDAKKPIELENEVVNSVNEMRIVEADEPKNIICKSDESKDLMPLICREVSSDLHESEEPALVRDEACSLESEKVQELPQRIDNATDNISVVKEEKIKSEKILKSKKGTTPKKAASTPISKKKPAIGTPKSSLLSNSKLSRPVLSKSTISESRGSSKKEFGASPLIQRKPNKTETRRAAPTSLHMSLRLCPDRPEPAPTPTSMRKSVFLEKMGDKDIVKRAFKAFRNDLNQLSSSSTDKPISESQVPRKETGVKARSAVGTPQKKIEGVQNVVKKTPQCSQPGLRKSSSSTRLLNAPVGGDRSNDKSVSSNYSLRSRDKSERSKEFSRKPEEKANGKAAERTPLQSKIKKETETKRLPHDHHTKAAKPIPVTAKPKTSSDKKIPK